MMLPDDQAEKRADGRLTVADADRILAAYALAGKLAVLPQAGEGTWVLN